MTPSEPTTKRPTEPRRRDDDLAALILACGRDERPALQDLYRRTAGKLYGLALAAAEDSATADRALVQTYLDVFGEAATFVHDPERESAIAWLTARLARQLPELARLAPGTQVKPVDPPTQLWQKLDISLGLQRLDRHIKPGVATQPRGRDPMPNAHDRRIERQLRFWRTAGIAASLALVAALGVILTLTLRDGATGALAQPSPTEAPATEPTAQAPAPAPAPATAQAAPWLAILQPAGASRLWHIQHTDGRLEVTAMPPFVLADASPAADDPPRQLLALWAKSGVAGELHHLGVLDPAATTSLELPAALDSATLAFIVSLEPAAQAPGDGPAGPVLFAGGRAP